MNILNLIDRCISYYQKRIKIFRQHHYWNRIYNNYVKEILGGGCLTTEQKREVYKVYSPYNHRNYTAHTFYTLATGVFNANYMPDDLYYSRIDPYFNDWDRAKYVDNKAYYRLMYPGMKQPKLLCYRMNSFWYNENGELTCIQNVLNKLINTSHFFIKQATESEGGHGVVFVDSSKKSKDDIYNILNTNNLDIVIQEGLKQSKTLSAINESSVNTIRLLTLLHKTGDVSLYSSILRMGIGGAKVDNASSGGITVGIEDNGRLKKFAYSSNGKRYEVHSTSQVHFDNFVIPNYDKIKGLIKEQAKNFPHFRLVSWDIVLNEKDEPVIIEANLHFGEINFHQLNNGPLFGDDTCKILNEVFGK